jgi:hypothetical protein
MNWEKRSTADIKLFVSAPLNEDWLSKTREREALAHVCGFAHVEEKLIPKTYNFEGVTVTDEPVQIHLSIPAEAFEAILLQAQAAERRSQLLEMMATFSGISLPDKGGMGVLQLRDLDVSEQREYAVNSVQFSETTISTQRRRRCLRTACLRT